MEKIFIENLEKELYRHIKGRCSVTIIDDTLIIDIYFNSSLKWKYTIKNISKNISEGLSSRNVAQTTIKKYKNYIISKYFF